MTADALQALACTVIEYTEEMKNLTSIMSQSLTQSQETILVLSKQIQALQYQSKAKKPTTDRPLLDKKKRDNKLESYCWNHGRTLSIAHARPAFR